MSTKSGEGDSSNDASTDDAKNATRRMSLKFPPTNGTRAMFQNLESKFYDDKLFFVDSYTDGQQCTTHGNAWSALDPVEMRWCFSNNVKLAHTSFVKTLPKALRTQALTALTSTFGLVGLVQYAW